MAVRGSRPPAQRSPHTPPRRRGREAAVAEAEGGSGGKPSGGKPRAEGAVRRERSASGRRAQGTSGVVGQGPAASGKPSTSVGTRRPPATPQGPAASGKPSTSVGTRRPPATPQVRAALPSPGSQADFSRPSSARRGSRSRGAPSTPSAPPTPAVRMGAALPRAKKSRAAADGAEAAPAAGGGSEAKEGGRPTVGPMSPRGRAHDTDLWAYIWEKVEARPSPRTSPKKSRAALAALDLPKCQRGGALAPAKTRRRLVGKQPPTLVIEVRRRINTKSPPPRPAHEEPPRSRARSQAPQGACGHYDVLGLRRTATTAEVHAAYRRRALATHPDKGGEPRDFHRIVAAFEELADEARRAAYDQQLELFGRRDGLGAREGQAEQAKATTPGTGCKDGLAAHFGPARVAQVRLLATPPFAWEWFLSQMHSKSLEILCKLLRGVKVMPPPAEEICGEGGPMGKLLSWQGPTCITRLKSGYKVAVNWESLSVNTGLTPSLTQALDWQIALLGVRGVAQARMRSRARSGVALTEDELLQVLESEPSMELAFTITVQLQGKGKKKGKTVSAPAVPDLHTAMDFRRRFLEVAGASSPEAPLLKEKRRAEQEASELRKRRRTSAGQLLAATARELKRRSASQASPRRERPVLVRRAASAAASPRRPSPRPSPPKGRRPGEAALAALGSGGSPRPPAPPPSADRAPGKGPRRSLGGQRGTPGQPEFLDCTELVQMFASAVGEGD